MDIRKVDAVERELFRVEDAIKALRAIHVEQKRQELETGNVGSQLFTKTHVSSPLHTGALKRASMDLTRALAQLRKP